MNAKSGTHNDESGRIYFREARKGQRFGRRALAALGIVAILGIVGGYAWAQSSLLTEHSISTTQSGYTGNGTADPNFGIPTLGIDASPPATCASTAAYPGASFSTQVTTISVTGTCSASYFAEEWTFQGPASGTAETAFFYVTTSYGSPSVNYSSTVTVTVSSWTASYAGTPTLDIIVEYGVGAPSGGIASLSVVAT
jgi:hypothetical protein